MPISTSKAHAFNSRQEDTGWGRAIASSTIPFYALGYAISRKTITPLLYATGITWAGLAIVVLFAIVVNPNSSKPECQTAMQQDHGFIGYLATWGFGTFGFKAGIDQARRYARKRLNEDSNASTEVSTP